MNEHQESVPVGFGPQEKLKRDLLDGKILTPDFVAQVIALDQSVPTKVHAEANVWLLTDKDVVAVIENDPSVRSKFHVILSLSHFHVGQRKLVARQEGAKGDFEKALRSSEGDDRWLLYVQATLAYLDKDVTTLETLASRMPDGTNRKIVGNMLRGLKLHGNVDYLRDYRNTIEKEVEP